MIINVFWDIKLLRLVKIYQHFGKHSATIFRAEDEAVCSPRTAVNFSQTKIHHIQKHGKLHEQLFEG
jgi:hypothetical protein